MGILRPNPMASASLRLRLLARVTAALAVVFTVAAITLYFLMRASLLAEFDAALLTQASAIQSLTEQDNAKIKLELEPGELPDFAKSKRPNYFQLRSGDGRSQVKSISLGEQELTPPVPPDSGPSFHALRLPSGKSGRAIILSFKPRFEDEKEKGVENRSKQTAVLIVARPTHDLDNTLERLAWLLLGVSTGAIVASVIVMSLVIQRGLSPLNTLATSIERVGENDLSERIRIDETPREMAPVVQRLNDLLARLDSAMTREKSFTADVAHELRTPLAGLETMLEVCASRRRDPEAYETVVGKSLRLTQGMHAMVDNLLLLARADARQLSTDPEPTDMVPFMQECWVHFAGRAAARKLNVEWKIDPNSIVKLDREKMRIVLNNLFDNAVSYADEEGRVWVNLAMASMAMTLTVGNTGSRIATADAGKLFDRFWRGDEARSDAGVHCGLGLSLCRKMVDILGGTLTADSVDGMFAATLVIRRADSESAH